MVLRSRLPSWIILCSVWLFRFAHTGEAQAAKEGKGMRETKSLGLFIAFRTPSLCGGLAEDLPAAASCLSAPPLISFYFNCCCGGGGRKEQDVYYVYVHVRENRTTAFALGIEVWEVSARDRKAWGWGDSPRARGSVQGSPAPLRQP